VWSDLGSFIKDLFNSWWARIGVLNGVVSYAGRIHSLEFLNPYIGTVFIWAGVLCVGMSILLVYHEQKQEIRDLEALLSDRGVMKTILIDKLRGEVRNNIEHLSEGAMLHDDAWGAIGPADLKYLPRDIRNLASAFYTDVRSLRGLLNGSDPRESGMRKRKGLREKLESTGKELLESLSRFGDD
jgi:hypothetical protein